MNFRIVSRLLAATTIMLSGTMFAIITKADVDRSLFYHKFTVGGTFVADHIASKNEHAKKAFIESIGHSLDKKDIKAEDFAEHLFINYGIRKGGELLADRGLLPDKKDVLKKLDVAPNGIVRDIVNPVVEGAAEVATHPETLTLVTMYVIQNYIIPLLEKK